MSGDAKIKTTQLETDWPHSLWRHFQGDFHILDLAEMSWREKTISK